jgi:hypothetical protein
MRTVDWDRTKRDGLAAAVVALIPLVSLFPAAAAGDPLLSGYGGPGQGNQIILGATLLGGEGPPRGSGQGAGPGTGVQPGTVQLSAGGANQGQLGHSGNAAPGRPAASGTRHAGSATGPPVRVAEGGTAAAVPSSALGLSDSDWLRAAIVVGLLMLVAMLTSRLATGENAKGPVARTRRDT